MKTRGRSFLHPPFPRPASGRISTSLGIDISGRRELNHLSFECWRPRYQVRTAAGRRCVGGARFGGKEVAGRYT